MELTPFSEISNDQITGLVQLKRLHVVPLEDWNENSETRPNVVMTCWPYGEIESVSKNEAVGAPVKSKVRADMIAYFFVLVWMVGFFVMGMHGTYLNSWTILLFFYSCFMLISLMNVHTRGPSYIVVNDSGVEFQWAVTGVVVRKHLIAWENLAFVHLEKSTNGKPEESLISFVKMNSDKAFKIKLSSIASREIWARMVKAMSMLCPVLSVDPSIFRALAPSEKDPAYTELWLEAFAAAPKRERLQPLAAETVLKDGRYKVVRQIGVGGQGRAYKAMRGDETVVLKEYMLPVFVDAKACRKALERFESEARVLKTLNHPNIVALEECFVEDHRAYLVLEYIEGDSLRSLIREKGPMSESRAVELGLSMCEILEYLHGQSPAVVHRDFTPDNLIMNGQGKLKLIDFMVAQKGDSTCTTTVVGKHAYLPPEQFRGKATTQSDIYALGATLCFLLVGQDPEPLTQTHPKTRVDISEDLDKIIARLTALDLANRYENIKDIRLDLQNIQTKACA